MTIKLVIFFFYIKILDGHGVSSESVPSRAVAKKSTTKRPESITDRQQEQQQVCPAAAEKSQQPQGRIEVICHMSFCFCFQSETNDSYFCSSLHKPFYLLQSFHLHNYHASTYNLHTFLPKVFSVRKL
jgi:hypothetical protein